MIQCRESPKPNKDENSRLLIRPIKVAILGAGSAAFARRLMTDLLCVPGLERGTFALVDIDRERLDLARRMGERLVEQSGRAVVLGRSRQAALQALMLDPLTAAVCSLEEIRQMFEEMGEAERTDLTAFF